MPVGQEATESVLSQESLRSFYDRRHPEYMVAKSHWDFLFDTYRGGRSWFETHIYKYVKEGSKEFKERKNRAYRFNHSREVVDLVQKYLFKGKIKRNSDDAPEQVKKLWDNTMRGGANIDTLIHLASKSASIGGRSAIVMDNNFPDIVDENGEEVPISVAESENLRVYAYVVEVGDILDYAWDEDGDGQLLWIKLREWVRDDSDPMLSSGLVEPRVRLWTRYGWSLYNETDVVADDVSAKAQGATSSVASNPKPKKPSDRNIQLIDEGYHGLGFVPVRLIENTITADPYYTPSLIEDIAYLDRAVANYLSNLDAIIQDQTFSQLAIPAQGLQRGDDVYKKVVEMGTKRMFVYDSGQGSNGKPEFLSPDPKQAGVILTVINKIINEIYHTVGLAGERTKEDNAVGIDNSSGVAKAYDFERVNSLLLNKAQICEDAENWMVKTTMAWWEEEYDENLVSYPTSFDVQRLADELVIAEALQKVDAPMEIRKEQMRAIVDKLFPQLKKDIRKKILSDVDKWVKEAESKFGTQPGGSTAAPKRQGQVTPDTKSKDGDK